MGHESSSEQGGDPVHLIDRTTLPDGDELFLLRCGDDWAIHLGDQELMGSTDHTSEEALARFAADRVPSLDGKVLIGGLGMGFTLGAALDAWADDAQVEVAELVPAVVNWAQGPLAHIFGNKLSDPRLVMTIADVHDVIDRASDHYDAILLDVDNGPDGMVQTANERLYCNWGLRSAHSALRAGGVLAVWSAYRDDHFANRLRDADFAVEQIMVPAFSDGGPEQHCIWLAAKTGGDEQKSPKNMGQN